LFWKIFSVIKWRGKQFQGKYLFVKEYLDERQGDSRSQIWETKLKKRMKVRVQLSGTRVKLCENNEKNCV
jgi:hypothetical protein